MQTKTFKIKTDKIIHDVSISHREKSKDLAIFFHGLGCSKNNYRYAFDHPGYKNTSILSFDLIGYGDSSKPDEFSYTMEDQAEICSELIQKFPNQDLHIAAHSMGGAVALLLSDDILSRVKTFANLEGNLISDDCFLSRKVLKFKFEIFQKRLLPKIKAGLESNKDQFNDLVRTSEKAFYKSCKSLVHWSDSGKLLEKFKALECPKAYFYGEKNSKTEIFTVLNDIPRIEISKSGHFMMMDNPEEFYDKLISFQCN